MSGNSRASSPKRRRAPDRNSNEPDFIIPQSKWALGHFETYVQQLRRNDGSAVSYLRKFTEPFEHVEAVTPVYLPTGEPMSMEVRLAFRNDKGEWDKRYYMVFTAQVDRSSGIQHLNTNVYYSISVRSSLLVERGMYFPTNAPALVAIVNAYHGGADEPQPVVLWSEGEKSRLGLEARLSANAELFHARHWNVVTGATLGGMTGARGTNYSLVPRSERASGEPRREDAAAQEFRLGSRELLLKNAIHIFVRDNDTQGLHEAFESGTRLIEEFGVLADNVRLAHPPAGLGRNDGWDDADPLPEGVSDTDRINQIIHAKPIKEITKYEQWLKKREIYVQAKELGLRVSRNGTLYNDMVNVILAMSQDDLLVDAFEFDLMRENVVETKPLPDANGVFELWNIERRMLREDTVAKVHYLMQSRFFGGIARSTIHEAIVSLARTAEYHPIRDYLNGLRWDGVARVDTFLHKYYNTPNDEYHLLASRVFLRSMVARIFEPACKVDTVIYLQGGQGLKKSTSCEILAGEEFFSSTLPSLHNNPKDAQLHVIGLWLIEIPELASIRRADIEDYKAFFSTRRAKVRPPYARVDTWVDRQCIFVATINPEKFLKDPTGERRAVPVRVGMIDLDKLRQDRDQLFAEVVAGYRLGGESRRWWYEGEEETKLFKQQQDDAKEVDSLEEEIIVFFRRVKVAMAEGSPYHYRYGFTFKDLCEYLYNHVVGIGQRDSGKDNRILNMIKMKGCKLLIGPSGKAQELHGRGKVWLPPETLEEVDFLDVPNVDEEEFDK